MIPRRSPSRLCISCAGNRFLGQPLSVLPGNAIAGSARRARAPTETARWPRQVSAAFAVAKSLLTNLLADLPIRNSTIPSSAKTMAIGPQDVPVVHVSPANAGHILDLWRVRLMNNVSLPIEVKVVADDSCHPAERSGAPCIYVAVRGLDLSLVLSESEERAMTVPQVTAAFGFALSRLRRPGGIWADFIAASLGERSSIVLGIARSGLNGPAVRAPGQHVSGNVEKTAMRMKEDPWQAIAYAMSILDATPDEPVKCGDWPVFGVNVNPNTDLLGDRPSAFQYWSDDETDR